MSRNARSWRVIRRDGSRCLLVLRHATGFAGRLRGLLGSPLPAPDHGLWLEPCRSVHSFGMRGPIDLLFVDAAHSVIEAHAFFTPGRSASCCRARSVIELGGGESLRLRITAGARLEPADVSLPREE